MKRNILIGAIAAVVIVAAALVVILVPFGGGSDEEARAKAETLFVSMRDQGGTATYQAAESKGDTVIIKNLTLVPPAKATQGKKRTITVEELRINELDWKNVKQPDFADIEFKGVRIPEIKDDPQFQQFSKITGLNELVISGRMKYRFDAAKQTVIVEPFRLTVDQMGTITFELGLEGINVAQLKSIQPGTKMDPGQLMGLASQVKLRSLTLVVKDNGGVDKAMKMAAEREKKSVEDVRKEQIAKIDAVMASPMAQSKLVSEALTAAKKFLTSPGTLTVSAKPASPVALFPVFMQGMAGGPKPAALDSIKSTLNLTITAE